MVRWCLQVDGRALGDARRGEHHPVPGMGVEELGAAAIGHDGDEEALRHGGGVHPLSRRPFRRARSSAAVSPSVFWQPPAQPW